MLAGKTYLNSASTVADLGPEEIKVGQRDDLAALGALDLECDGHCGAYTSETLGAAGICHLVIRC